MPTSRPRIPVSQWTDPRHVRGLLGERTAARWLRARGWEVLDHRFRVGRHDLDLVARRGHLVAFVEVKTRSGAEFGSPVEAIGWRKRLVLANLADVWRARHGRSGEEYRFDVAAVTWRPGRPAVVEMLEDAWRLG
ncbi:MAG TPA: YraN family protein [Gemmatimonadales bacterium]|nr:YraN family protein [Gemmatimonadales bacterium]